MRIEFNTLYSLACVMTLAVATPSVTLAQTHAPAPLRSLEEAIESSTEEVLLPTSVPGSLTFKNCTPPCSLQTLDVSSSTQFLVGSSTVTLREFRDFIAKSGSQFLMVFHKPGDRAVTRLMVFGQIDRD